MAETKKKDAPTVFDTNDELRECLKLDKTSPTVEQINALWYRSLMRLKSKPDVKDYANFERTIDVAILFIQKLYRTGVAFPAPSFNYAPNGSIKFTWNRPEHSELSLGCAIVHTGDDCIPVVGISYVYRRNVDYRTLAFGTEQEQDKTIETVVKMLDPIITSP